MSDYEFIDGYACASIMRVQAAANQKYSNPQTVTVSIGHFQAASKVTAVSAPPDSLYYLYLSYWSNLTGGGLQKISENLLVNWFIQPTTTIIPAEDHHSAYRITVDNAGNSYVSFLSLTPPWLENIIRKFDKNGTLLWSAIIPTGFVSGLAVSPAGDYLYFVMNYGLQIVRVNAVTGLQSDGDGFPCSGLFGDPLAGIQFVQLLYGADGYLYTAQKGDIKAQNSIITKINPASGAQVWQYQLPQGASGTMRSINTIDVNSSGQVVIAAIKTGEFEIDGIGEAVTCLNADGSLKFRALAGVRSGTGPICYGAVIMEDGTVYEVPSEGTVIKIVHIDGSPYYSVVKTDLMPDPIYVNEFPYYPEFTAIMKSPDEKSLYLQGSPSLTSGNKIARIDLTGQTLWEYETLTGDYFETETMISNWAMQQSRVSARRIDIAIRCGGEVNLGDITGVVG